MSCERLLYPHLVHAALVPQQSSPKHVRSGQNHHLCVSMIATTFLWVSCLALSVVPLVVSSPTALAQSHPVRLRGPLLTHHAWHIGVLSTDNDLVPIQSRSDPAHGRSFEGR